MRHFIWREGGFETLTTIEVGNRATMYGDGFFETMLCEDGYPAFWNRRRYRIEKTCDYLGLDPSFEIDDLLSSMISACRADGNVVRARLTFFRAGGGKYAPESNDVEVILGIEPLGEKKFNRMRVRSAAKAHMVLDAERASNFKLIGRHQQVRAALEARERGLDDMVLLNGRGHLCAALSGNLYLVMNDEVCTPPLSSGCLDGVIRYELIAAGLVKEVELSMTDMAEATGVFSSNSIAGLTELNMHGGMTALPLEEMRKKLSVSMANSILDLRESLP